MKIIHNKKALSSWMWVGLYSIMIFLTVPVARTVQAFVSNKLGKEVFIYFVLFLVGIGFISMLYFFIFKLKVYSASNIIWLCILTGIYSYFTLKLTKTSIEAIHFLEYGLLGFFLFRALKHHIKDKSIYFIAALFALLVGTFDEIIQWITPQRMWDFRDVGFNVLSGGLFQLVIWKVVRPKIIAEKINASSLKIFSSVFTLCLIIIGLCALNTPQRVAWYTNRIPFLSFLQKEEPMSEFGYKFKDPEIGAFYSRLSPKNLKKTDNLKGEQYAQILNESVDKDYDEFLRQYNPITNAFIHELRIHIFRRDTHTEKARATSEISKRKESYFIAYKENLILERYFSYTIEKSVYRWNKDMLRESEALIDKSEPYESPVSKNLFTAFSEKTVWIAIFVLISLLVLINLILSYLENQRKAIKL
jgi:hypothetical protein